MSKTKASSLSAGLIAKKGQAVPATASVAPIEDVAAPAPAPAVSVEPAPQSQAQPEAKGSGRDPRGWLLQSADREAQPGALRKAPTLGMRLDKKSQAIFEAALDDYPGQARRQARLTASHAGFRASTGVPYIQSNFSGMAWRLKLDAISCILGAIGE